MKVMVRQIMSLLLVVCPAAVGAIAAEGEATPGRGELQREMRRFFADRLRAELDLTDEQVEQVMPRLQESERERAEVRREKVETLRRLRRGVESGASDDELQELLERLDAADRRQLELKEQLFDEIDRSLSVRQRVRLRFFVERFPRMLREKIEDLRRGAPLRGDRGREGPGDERP
jgi:Spy/CpxP family protein refolding chaperone